MGRLRTVQIGPEVRDVLERSIIVDAVIRLPAGQLERPLYEAVDKALRAMGGKWDRRCAGHVFPKSPAVALAEALGDGWVVDRKRTLEQFWTPPEVAGAMFDLAGDVEGTDVLEPSAGNGCLLFEIIGRGGLPVAVEIDQGEALQLESETEGKVPISCADFMAWTPRPPYTPTAFDFVIMNPPFSRGQDMAHVRRAFDFLKPGGVLVSVMSPHWTFATDQASNDFRVMLSRMPDDQYDWGELPAGSFKREGTGVNCGLLRARK